MEIKDIGENIKDDVDDAVEELDALKTSDSSIFSSPGIAQSMKTIFIITAGENGTI